MQPGPIPRLRSPRANWLAFAFSCAYVNSEVPQAGS